MSTWDAEEFTLTILWSCRSYYRCTQDNCRVKKRVERLAEDPRMVITTYEGRHCHSPSHDTENSPSSSHISFFGWHARFVPLSSRFSLDFIACDFVDLVKIPCLVFLLPFYQIQNIYVRSSYDEKDWHHWNITKLLNSCSLENACERVHELGLVSHSPKYSSICYKVPILDFLYRSRFLHYLQWW